MITIDGSQGEGGGQILRTAVSCGGMLGEAVRIKNIRANRSKPGLKRQHLTAVRAVAEICGAKLEGAELNSSELVFEPGAPRGGNYHFAIGSAGSVTLVAQTIIPVLLMAPEASNVVIEGGTHVQGAPIFEFFDEVYLPQLRRMGCDVSATLERHGFFPAGGGRIRLAIKPLKTPSTPISLKDAGNLRSVEIVALYSVVDRRIPQAEAELIASKLEDFHPSISVREVDAICPGNAVYAKLAYDNITEIFSAIGAVDVSRKAVAEKVVKRVKDYLKVGQPVGQLLADQLLLPILRFGKSGAGAFRTCAPSQHFKTNLDVLRAFDNSFETCATELQNGGIEFAISKANNNANNNNNA